MALHEHAFLYVDCDVPDGVTLADWRSAKAPARRRRRLGGLLRATPHAQRVDHSATARISAAAVGNEVI